MMVEVERQILLLLLRTDAELDRVVEDIADLKADMRVRTATLRRLDGSIQNLTSEVRALAGQQDRQRQKLERLAARLDRLDAPEPV
jgi:septal ring factor EnvC (AmiA/AmiB activator)